MNTLRTHPSIFHRASHFRQAAISGAFLLFLSIFLLREQIQNTLEVQAAQVEPRPAAPGIRFSGGWASRETHNTSEVTWGDINGDGALDLAVSNGSTLGGQVNEVYLNNGRGNLQLGWQSVGDERMTISQALGDLDGDGDLDLAYGNDQDVSQVYKNAGDGTFSLAWESTGYAMTTRSIALGDLENDGDLDLAIGNIGQVNQVYRNDGSGNFTLAWESTGDESSTQCMAWGDMDGDGYQDLVIGNNNAQVNQVYRNNGNGGFSLAWESSGDVHETVEAALGDMDGDADLDIAIANTDLNNGQAKQVYRNNGSMQFALAWESSGDTRGTWDVAWGDADGDGDLDLAFGSTGAANQVYRNDGNGSFSLGWESTGDIKATYSVAWGDADHDGDLDLAFGNSTSQINQVYLNNSDWGATLAWSAPEANKTQSVALGDMDGDGDLDIACANYGKLANQVYRNDANNTFTPAWESGDLKDTTSVAWGDMDGDGDLDLAFGNADDAQGGEVNQVYRNDGSGNFSLAWESTGDLKNTYSVAWGDMDGDGDLDLAFANGSTGLFMEGQINQVYRNNGNGSFSPAWESTGELKDTASVAWGDVDSDGDLDLVFGNRKDFDGDINQVYLNNGSGSFRLGWESTDDAEWTEEIALGDMDGDGDLDMVVANTLQVNQVFYNDGTGNFSPAWESTGDTQATSSISLGDVDGDGDLDIAFGNLTGLTGGAVNQVYRNEGNGNYTLIWDTSGNLKDTSSTAWGDMDRDGDLDLVFGNDQGVNQIYANHRLPAAGLPDTPPSIAIFRPDGTDNAGDYSAAIILNSTSIAIPYKLYDAEGDPAPMIRAYYSVAGGGQWLPATAAADVQTTDLHTAPWPAGTSHTFTWNAAADLIKSDHVAFRIEVYQGAAGPYQWPYTAVQSASFRVEQPWFIRVVDEQGAPIPGATIYRDGQAITQTLTGATTTDGMGLLNPGSLAIGTKLTTLVMQKEQPTGRDGHDGWAYRIYTSNVGWAANGALQEFSVSAPGEQRLAVRQDRALVLFNLLISIEWDATDEYTAEIMNALRSGSDYLYDLTDGQMAIGQVNIYDNGIHWAEADIQISARNNVRPHAYVGGLTADNKSYVIRLGRFWNGASGSQGSWQAQDGYRTLIHEFAHYGLYLYDEYFGYLFDDQGNLLGEVEKSCTGIENRNPAGDATNASVMDHHYTSSELAMRGVNGLWSSACEQTAQWQINGESDWDTITRMYGDNAALARWQFLTPGMRGILPGPTAPPASLPDIPLVNVHASGPSAPPRQLTVYGPEGLYLGALVALYKQNGQVIGQGFTDQNGRLDVFGALENDMVRAISFDGGLTGSATIGSAMSLTLTLRPVLLSHLQQQTLAANPYIQMRAEPGLSADQIEVLVALYNFGPGADPDILLTEPGSTVGHSLTMSYSSTTGVYEGRLSFSAVQQGLGQVRVVATPNDNLIRMYTTYHLQQIHNDRSQDVYANDGNLSLHFDTASLPGDSGYLIITPPGAIPGSPPAGMLVVGDPYNLTLSGAVVNLQKPAVLKMIYHQALLDAQWAPQDLQIYWWNPSSQTWEAIPGEVDEYQKAIVAQVTRLGIYALMAPGAGTTPIQDEWVYLPVIIR